MERNKDGITHLTLNVKHVATIVVFLLLVNILMVIGMCLEEQLSTVNVVGVIDS
jgi:hypothetical protein